MRDDPSITDLITRARKGDERAWKTLVERFAPLMWSICRRHQLTGADADDISQTVWLQLAGHLGNIRDPAALPGWLATTTRRECSKASRAAHRPGAPAPLPDLERIPAQQASTPEDELLTAERHAALRMAFGRLSPCCQQLIALLAEDPPMPYAQISATLGIPVGGIGPRRSRCLNKLRRDPALAALIDAQDASTEMSRSPAAAQTAA